MPQNRRMTAADWVDNPKPPQPQYRKATAADLGFGQPISPWQQIQQLIFGQQLPPGVRQATGQDMAAILGTPEQQPTSWLQALMGNGQARAERMTPEMWIGGLGGPQQ